MECACHIQSDWKHVDIFSFLKITDGFNWEKMSPKNWIETKGKNKQIRWCIARQPQSLPKKMLQSHDASLGEKNAIAVGLTFFKVILSDPCLLPSSFSAFQSGTQILELYWYKQCKMRSDQKMWPIEPPRIGRDWMVIIIIIININYNNNIFKAWQPPSQNWGVEIHPHVKIPKAEKHCPGESKWACFEFLLPPAFTDEADDPSSFTAPMLVSGLYEKVW